MASRLEKLREEIDKLIMNGPADIFATQNPALFTQGSQSKTIKFDK